VSDALEKRQDVTDSKRGQIAMGSGILIAGVISPLRSLSDETIPKLNAAGSIPVSPFK